MLKVAYFCFIAALMATPVHLIAGNSQSRVLVLGLLIITGLFVALGVRRRP